MKCKLPSIITGYIEIRWNLFNIHIFIDIQLVKEGIKDKRIFYVSILSFHGVYENEKEKNWTSPMGIWTLDFWTRSHPQFDFWGRLKQ